MQNLEVLKRLPLPLGLIKQNIRDAGIALKPKYPIESLSQLVLGDGGAPAITTTPANAANSVVQ